MSSSWGTVQAPNSQAPGFMMCDAGDKGSSGLVFLPTQDMTEVMVNSSPMDDMRLSPSKDRLSFQGPLELRLPFIGEEKRRGEDRIYMLVVETWEFKPSYLPTYLPTLQV
ncbi:hypothetical protein CRUP_014816 [Coryphaenoides rupestris]|nr:hypothetical protein CRUP_014816 [Coryphaenoides rupestris]